MISHEGRHALIELVVGHWTAARTYMHVHECARALSCWLTSSLVWHWRWSFGRWVFCWTPPPPPRESCPFLGVLLAIPAGMLSREGRITTGDPLTALQSARRKIGCRKARCPGVGLRPGLAPVNQTDIGMCALMPSVVPADCHDVG